jgi:hypothetical protein
MMKARYYLYLFVCWFTKPFRLLIPKHKDQYFAVWLLFRNRYKVNLLTAMMRHETGDFKSAIYTENKNCFGMKKSKAAEYQDGVNRSHAQYKTVYQSVFDFYDLTKNRIKGYGKAINDTQGLEPFKMDSLAAETYRDYVLAQFKSLGYFEDSLANYTNGVNHFAKRDENPLWRFILCLALGTVVPTSLIILLALYVNK